MSWMRMPFTVAGQYVSATAMVAVFAAGCFELGGGAGDLFGTIVNTDTSKDLIGGVRLRSEEAAYAFGRFDSNGEVAEITSVVFRDGSGQTATLHLESGRPSRAIGFDGSRLQIIYHEVTTQRLRGQVIFTPAGGSAQTYDFDVDLQQTAQQVADLIEETLGIEITNQPPPDDTTTARSTGAPADPREKTAVEGVVVLAVPVILVVTGFTINLVLGQILKAMVDLADAIVKSFIVAALTPFVFMGNLLRLAAGQPLVTLEYNEESIGDGDIVLTIPRPQPF